MKKSNVILVLLAIGMLVSVSQAGFVDGIKIELASISGATSSYDHTTNTTSWSNGASGWIMSEGYEATGFTSAAITGTFSGAVDTSSGGLASAIFNTGTWTMSLTKGGLQVDITGSIVGNYVETEGKLQEGHIDGRAVVIVETATFTFGDYFGNGSAQLNWKGGTGSQAGLIADITLPNGSTFGDYDTESYNSTNTTITLWADEGVVPEPASLCLLGLGAVGLLKRRRA